jgi:hypothetical protein
MFLASKSLGICKEIFMFRDVYVPRCIIVPLVLACILLLSSVSVALAASEVQLQRFAGPRPQHYLALGDSLAYGFQPNGDHTHGYVDDFFSFLQSRGVQDHQNLGCPGETSSTFISGGICYPSPSSQLATAVDYLRQQAHVGQVSLVMLDIGRKRLAKGLYSQTCMISEMTS